MTTPIEVTRREMYEHLEVLKFACPGKPMIFGHFESALEAHLEELRKAMVLINESTVACARQSAESFLDLENRLDAMTEERDGLRNRLQAFEYANKSAGEFLQESRAKIKAQRQSIGQLKNDRNNAQALAAVNYEKYQKARKELSELRKSSKAPKSSQEASFGDDCNPYGAERQIASCRVAVDRWLAIDGTSDKQALQEIIEILREIPE